MATTLSFDIWTAYVRQAYLQASEPLMRDVFLKPPAPELSLSAQQALKLIKPLYGLCDSGDIWHRTRDLHRRNDLHMQTFRSDPSLYAHYSRGKLSDLSGTYIDNILR